MCISIYEYMCIFILLCDNDLFNCFKYIVGYIGRFCLELFFLVLYLRY